MGNSCMSVNAEDMCTTTTMINLKDKIKECLRVQLLHDPEHLAAYHKQDIENCKSYVRYVSLNTH